MHMFFLLIENLRTAKSIPFILYFDMKPSFEFLIPEAVRKYSQLILKYILVDINGVYYSVGFGSTF